MNDDLVLKTLIAARKLIDTPEKWAKRAENGPKHCAGLACFTAGGNSDGGPGDRAWDFLESLVPGDRHLAAYNDAPATTHADILALFDRAISLRAS